MPFSVINDTPFRWQLCGSDDAVFRDTTQILLLQYLKLINPDKNSDQPTHEKDTYQMDTKADPFFFLKLHGNKMICSGFGGPSPSF